MHSHIYLGVHTYIYIMYIQCIMYVYMENKVYALFNPLGNCILTISIVCKCKKILNLVL